MSRPNLLHELDGQRKYIFSANGEKLFLRVVTSPAEIMKCPRAVELYSTIISEARQDLGEELASKGEALKNPAVKMSDEEKAARAKRAVEGAPSKFGKDDNITYFIIENEAGEPVLTLSLALNNPAITRGLAIDESTNHLLFQGVVIDKKYRGQSIASAAFDAVFLAICERITQRPLEVIAPVSSTEIVKSDGRVEEFLVHGDLYLDMLRRICGDSVCIQPRVRKGWEGDYEKAQGDRIPGSECDPEKIKAIMKGMREAEMKPGADIAVGAFVIGSFTAEKTFEVLADEAKSRMDKRTAKGIIKEKDMPLDWVKVSPPASFGTLTADSLVVAATNVQMQST